MNSEYYVYLHRRKSDNKIFYVGKGKGNRIRHCSGRNSRWQRTVNKHGFVTEVLFENLTEEEAFFCEKDTILELRYFGVDLVNMTDGGEGSSGYRFSKEAKLKMSMIRKGRIKSEQECRNISKAQKGKKVSDTELERLRNSRTGKKDSISTIAKRKESILKSGTNDDRSLYVFYSDDDCFIGTRKDLSDYTGIARRSFRTLFQKKSPSKKSNGWSILTLVQLFILKGNHNDSII